MAPEDADARTLLSLLHARRARGSLSKHPNIVTELMYVSDEDLAKDDQPEDFIVSDRLISLLLAQISEEPTLEQVFSDLFDSSGTDVLLEPASAFGLGGVVTFDDALKAASRRGQTAIGWRPADGNDRKAILNPSSDGSKTVDALVVLAPARKGPRPMASRTAEQALHLPNSLDADPTRQVGHDAAPGWTNVRPPHVDPEPVEPRSSASFAQSEGRTASSSEAGP